MRTERLLFALATALFLVLPAACGDDGGSAADLSGLYQVKTYTEANGDCAGTPVPETDTTHLFLKSGTFFGVTTLQVIGCAQAEGCGQDAEAFPEFTFLQRSGSGWFTTASSSSSGGGSCSMGFDDQRLTPTATGIHIERTFSSGTFELPEAQCTADAAEQRKAELTCEQKVVIDADAL